MTDRIAADSERLRSTRARMADLADEIGSVRLRLTQALESEGRCWGTDDPGQAFDAAYAPASAYVQTLLADAEASVDEFARKLDVLTTVFVTAELDAEQIVV